MAMLDLKISEKLVVGDKIVVVYDELDDSLGVYEWNHVFCYDKDENFLWQISDGRKLAHWAPGGLGERGDNFSGVEIEDGELVVFTMSTHVYQVDIETGQILKYLRFTK